MRAKHGKRVGGLNRKESNRLPGLTVKEGFTRHPFDEANGVQTSGLVAGRHLRSGHAHDLHATAYYGVAPSLFASLMRRWRRSELVAPIRDFTFVDAGCGMGRALFLAAGLPFKSVEGVELNPVLVRIARKNLRSWQKKGPARLPIRVTCGDAVEYSFPAGPCLIFLFNPFGAVVMRRLLKRLADRFEGRPRELDLICVNNEQERVLELQSGFRRLFLGQIRRSRADAIADHKILANQPEGEYASSNYEDRSIWRWFG